MASYWCKYAFSGVEKHCPPPNLQGHKDTAPNIFFETIKYGSQISTTTDLMTKDPITMDSDPVSMNPTTMDSTNMDPHQGQ